MWHFPWRPAYHLTLHHNPALSTLCTPWTFTDLPCPFGLSLYILIYAAHITSSKIDFVLDYSVTFRCINFSQVFSPPKTTLVTTSSVPISCHRYLSSLICKHSFTHFTCTCVHMWKCVHATMCMWRSEGGLQPCAFGYGDTKQKMALWESV